MLDIITGVTGSTLGIYVFDRRSTVSCYCYKLQLFKNCGILWPVL